MASRRLEEKRSAFQRYKEDVQREGKPFYPYAMFHDTVMSLVVVSVIIGLACVWYFTSGPDPKTCGSGDSCLLGPRYSDPADHPDPDAVPRPAARAGSASSPGSGDRGRAGRALDGRADVQGRDRQGG